MENVVVVFVGFICVALIVLNRFTKMFEGKMQELDQKVSEKFENASNKAIKDSLVLVQDTSSKEVVRSLKPVFDQLRTQESKFDDQMRSFESKMDFVLKQSAVQEATIAEKLKSISDMQRNFSEEATVFTKAMRGNIRALGQFGEDVAEKILKASALNEGKDYLKQKILPAEFGDIKPDFAILLTQNRAIFVDAKTPLDSYMACMEGDDEAKKKLARVNFVSRIKDHIKDLVKANYSSCTSFKSMGFVIMFVPSQQAIDLAIDLEPELLRDAYSKGIILAGPTSLMCSLKTIEFLWREERQVQNMKDIGEVGGHLYTKLCYMVQGYVECQKALDKFQESFKTSFNHLNRGDKSIISYAKKLNELGNFSQKQLPESEE